MSIDMEKEVKDLLFLLLKENDWITGDEIASTLKWSRKKVQQTMKRLTEDLKDQCIIVSQKNRGYLLQIICDELKKDLLMDIFYNETYFNLEERKVMLAVDLLFRKDYVSMDQLAEQYYTSTTVIFEEIRSLKRWFSRIKGLELEVSSRHGIKVHGKELIKRYWCSVYGQLNVLKLIDIPQSLLINYQKVIKSCSEYLTNEIIEDGIYICGEDFSLLLRYIAMTILRDNLGYIINDEMILFHEHSFFTNLEKYLQYKFSNIEKHLILSILQDANVVSFKTEMKVNTSDVMKIENFLLNKLNLKNLKLLDEHELLIHNFNCIHHRDKELRHSVNYYDKEILYKYPLCIHLANQTLLELYKNKPSRSDILDLAVYLGGILEKLHLYTNINVLLVGNQKYEILTQIKNVFISFFNGNINAFDLYPNYILKTKPDLYKKYDLCLTTEPDIMINNHKFIQVPIIMTDSKIIRFQDSIKKWQIRYYEQHLEKVRETVKQITIYDKITLNDIIDTSLRSVTVYSLNKHTLCMIQTKKFIDNKVIIYKLQKQYLYEYHSISKIIFISYDESKTDIIPYFYYVSKIIEEVM